MEDIFILTLLVVLVSFVTIGVFTIMIICHLFIKEITNENVKYNKTSKDIHMQTVITSTQLLKAPIGAIFICNSILDLKYVKTLAVHLGRNDLQIKSLDSNLHGLKGNKFVIDHSCNLTKEQRKLFLSYIGN